LAEDFTLNQEFIITNDDTTGKSCVWEGDFDGIYTLEIVKNVDRWVITIYRNNDTSDIVITTENLASAICPISDSPIVVDCLELVFASAVEEEEALDNPFFGMNF
jgi:hypothetical protein